MGGRSQLLAFNFAPLRETFSARVRMDESLRDGWIPLESGMDRMVGWKIQGVGKGQRSDVGSRRSEVRVRIVGGMFTNPR